MGIGIPTRISTEIELRHLGWVIRFTLNVENFHRAAHYQIYICLPQ